MTTARTLTALACLALTAGCPSGPENPPRLWLYLDGVETEVKLVDYEPEPF